MKTAMDSASSRLPLAEDDFETTEMACSWHRSVIRHSIWGGACASICAVMVAIIEREFISLDAGRLLEARTAEIDFDSSNRLFQPKLNTSTIVIRSWCQTNNQPMRPGGSLERNPAPPTTARWDDDNNHANGPLGWWGLFSCSHVKGQAGRLLSSRYKASASLWSHLAHPTRSRTLVPQTPLAVP